VLEVPGEDSAARADKLAEKPRLALTATPARAHRPVKTAEVRITGFDESVTPLDVEVTLANAGRCSPTELKIGPIKLSPGGTGSVWAQCPIGAANRLAAAGRVYVGWTMARVQLLAARPLQCFRCLALGHANTERSGACYRCGRTGYLAVNCTGRPHCVVCADLSRPAGHRCW